MEHQGLKSNFMIFIIAMIAAISGFLFGYDEGIIAGSLHLVVSHFDMTKPQIGIMTSALPFGALVGSMLIGALLASQVLRWISRRWSLMIAAALFFLGAIFAALSPTGIALSLSRFIIGLAIGVAAVTTPLYIAEISPARWRGALVSMYQLAITIGILCAYITNYILVKYNNWQIMFASASIPAFCLIIAIFFLPESPRWLISIGKKPYAKKALTRLRGIKEVDNELDKIEKNVLDENNNPCFPSIRSRKLLPPLTLCVLLFCFQQLSGINVVIYYTPIIFQSLGFKEVSNQILATIGIGALNVCSTILSLFLVDKFGRRNLLLIGFLGTLISLISLSVLNSISIKYTDFLSVTFLTLYIFSFAISLGPIPYILISELFPLKVRHAGMSIASASNWIFNGLIVLTFPLMLHNLGLSIVLSCYAFISLLGLMYTFVYVPETKNFSLEEIEEHILSTKPLRALGRH